jgi:lipoate---protein ligase
MMKVLDSGIDNAQDIMLEDERLLESLNKDSDVILHFYEWRKKSATYGLLIDPKDYLNIKEAENQNLSLAKRPTGGGIIFHIWDFAFSLLVPSSSKYFSCNHLENYKFVNDVVLKCIKYFLDKSLVTLHEDSVSFKNDVANKFCMAKATKYDVLCNKKKFAGAAQRKKKNGFLHQGSIFIAKPNGNYLKKIIKDESVLKAILENTGYLIDNDDENEMFKIKEILKKLLVKEFQKIVE